LLLVIWGLLRMWRWALWGALVLAVLMTMSTVLTLARSSMGTIFAAMALPPAELKFLANLQFDGWHLAVLAGIPLVATCVLTLFCGRHFPYSVRR
jgi:hypothetical protein